MATKQNTPSVNAVAERVASFASRTMEEEFGFGLNHDERMDVYNAVYGIVNNARVNEEQS